MKIYVNPMTGYEVKQVENIISHDVINYFGPGGDTQRKYVVINDNGDDESDDENDRVLMFEGTLEECYIYSEICHNWFEEIVEIYSEAMYKKLWEIE